MGEQKFGFGFNNRKNHRVTRKTNRFLLSKLAGLGQPFYYSPHAGWTKLTYANKSLDCSVKAKPLRCQWFRWFRVTLKATCFRCHFCCCEFVFWPPTKRVQMKLWYQFISFCLSHLLIWTNDFISEQLISVHPPVIFRCWSKHPILPHGGDSKKKKHWNVQNLFQGVVDVNFDHLKDLRPDFQKIPEASSTVDFL